MTFSSPATIGTSGQPPMNAVTTSVPPLIDMTGTGRPTPSWIQRNPEAGSGEPVEPTPRSASSRYSLPGLQFLLGAAEEIACARAEQRDVVVGDDLPHAVGLRIGRAAVVEHHRRADQQTGDQQVPHHPAGGRVPAEALAGFEVGVQAQVLEVLEHHAAVAVHDALRRAGGARGEQHPQRMGERHRGDLQRRVEIEDLRPRRDVVGGLTAQPGHQHRRLQCR